MLHSHAVGEKSDDQFHPDYITTIFRFVKSTELNDKGSWRSTKLFSKYENQKVKSSIVTIRQGVCEER